MKLDKKIQKYINKENFVKVYISNGDEELMHYEGFLFEHNKKYLLMSDLNDFNYDGFIIIKKSDIHEIKYTDNEKFFLHMLKEEGIKKKIYKKRKALKFKLSSMQAMMKNLQSLKIPIICEHLYGKKDIFQIGIIKKVSKKKAQMLYFNSQGEFDFKLLPITYASLTYIRIDSPYANIFYKYSK